MKCQRNRYSRYDSRVDTDHWIKAYSRRDRDISSVYHDIFYQYHNPKHQTNTRNKWVLTCKLTSPHLSRSLPIGGRRGALELTCTSLLHLSSSLFLAASRRSLPPSPTHVLMLSPQFAFGLPRPLFPGTVPCMNYFSYRALSVVVHLTDSLKKQTYYM